MMDWTDRHCRRFHRLLTRQALLYTEMVTADAIRHGDRGKLLGFDPEGKREALDLDYTGFGWCRPRRLWLQATEPGGLGGGGLGGGGLGGGLGGLGGGGLVEVREPLLLALHSADDGPALPGDLVLEFGLDGGEAVAAPLSLFLERWLPRLPSPPGDGPIVLALCNPHRAHLTAPAAAGGRPMLHALGDTDSWLDLAGDPTELCGPEEVAAGGRIRLAAAAWRQAAPRQGPPR